MFAGSSGGRGHPSTSSSGEERSIVEERRSGEERSRGGEEESTAGGEVDLRGKHLSGNSLKVTAE